MIKIAAVLCCGTTLLLAPIFAFASSCAKITNAINTDIQEYAGTIQSQHLPWMRLSWLQWQLGHADQQVTGGDYTQYIWRCKNEVDVSLQVTTDKKGVILAARGQYNSAEGSGLFAVQLPQPEPVLTPTIPTPPTAPKTIVSVAKPIVIPRAKHFKYVPPVVVNPVVKAIAAYNKHFKTSVQTQKQLSAGITAKFKNYYSNLRRCNPGNYSYATAAINGLVFPAVTIRGEQAGRCIVETTVTMPNLGKSFMHCEYRLPHLQLYTDKIAKMHGQSNHPAVQQAEKTDCKTFLNGKLLI